MSDESDSDIPLPPGITVMTLDIDLPAEATDEQRQVFRRAFKSRDGKSMFAFVKAEAGLPAITIEMFVSTLRERFGDDICVTVLPTDSPLTPELLKVIVDKLISLIRPPQV